MKDRTSAARAARSENARAARNAVAAEMLRQQGWLVAAPARPAEPLPQEVWTKSEGFDDEPTGEISGEMALTTRFRVECWCGNLMDRRSIVQHPDRDAYEKDNPLGTRGDWEEINLVCGSGHVGRVVSADHKGDHHIGLIGSARLVFRPIY